DGAAMIPFLVDLANQGERQIVLTNDQIAAADAYGKQTARLKTEFTQLAQTIASQSLPAVSDLTGAIHDAISQAIGLGGAADDLKNNSSIGQFADEGAIFLATLADYAIKVAEAFKGVGKAIGATIAVYGQALQGNFR